MPTPSPIPARDEPTADRSMLVLQTAIAVVAMVAAGLLAVLS
jgi:hypothetical protein